MLFSCSLMMGTLISISSMSWFSAWVGLEINMLSIMPLMKNFNNKLSSESTIKYFITQAIASMILLFSVLMFSNSMDFMFKMQSMMKLFLNTSLFLKMGAAPMHFWLPEVISGTSWLMTLTILTWQKIAPMILLIYSSMVNYLMLSVIILSSLIGGLSGLNQTCMKKIMAYSSINHISWMLAASMYSTSTWMIYFCVYSTISVTLILHLYMNNIYFMQQMSKLSSKNKTNKLIFSLNFLSLGGLPPFLGFFPKWLTIFNLSTNSMYYLSTILITLTLLSLFMYIRIMFTSMTMLESESIKMSTNNLPLLFLYIMINTSISFMSMMLSTPIF
uniref:NADH-ubiquinone oxidoreductase chain 2 n=1 Tax=Scolytinae sp. BMNH 1043001 TaxID=1903794 RepID=A0A343A580_9CUCU|nr:NADH dehydrogenase subunit 2 [Scolytinae sp. BMNH 1043001]